MADVEWRRFQDARTGKVMLGFGYAMTIDAAQGLTPDEHINAMPRGADLATGFTSYVGERRARGTTWPMTSEAATFKAVRNQRGSASGIIFVNRNGLRWRDAPWEYGPHKTLYNRWKRWDAMGIFTRMMDGLAAGKAEPRTIMIDATCVKAHRTASKPAAKKGDPGRLTGRAKGGMNTKLHAVTDQNGRPLNFFMTAGPISDYMDVAALADSLPAAQWMLGDRGYDADWFRDALEAKGIRPCISGRKSRGKPVKYDKRKYKRRNRIEIMFGRLKDWRRVATRYDRCPTVFFSAICLAATVMFWLWS